MTERKVTRTEIMCDGCDKELAATDDFVMINKCHFCKSCCEKIRVAARRVFDKMVPDRRGGERQLGTYDG